MLRCNWIITGDVRLFCEQCNYLHPLNAEWVERHRHKRELWPIRECKRSAKATRLADPGDHLHTLIARYFSTESSTGCGCGSMISQMNAWGVVGCREHLDEIIDHMLSQAKERGWWAMCRKMTRRAIFEGVKGATITPRAYVTRMVNKAILMAEEEAAKEPAKPNESGPRVDVVYRFRQWLDLEQQRTSLFSSLARKVRPRSRPRVRCRG